VQFGGAAVGAGSSSAPIAGPHRRFCRRLVPTPSSSIAGCRPHLQALPPAHASELRRRPAPPRSAAGRQDPPSDAKICPRP
jgi:hypothetical protein